MLPSRRVSPQVSAAGSPNEVGPWFLRLLSLHWSVLPSQLVMGPEVTPLRWLGLSRAIQLSVAPVFSAHGIAACWGRFFRQGWVAINRPRIRINSTRDPMEPGKHWPGQGAEVVLTGSAPTPLPDQPRILFAAR